MPESLGPISLNKAEPATVKLSQLQQHPPQRTILDRHKEKIAAAILWAVLILCFFWYASRNNLGFFEALRNITIQLVDVMKNNALGPLIFLAVYALRPIFLFPSSLLSISGGFLFGPIWGIIYTTLASNLSALVAFIIGRFFSQNLLTVDASAGIINKYASRMREHSFFTVLTMRLAFLPYDLVSYIAAMLDIDWKPFILATALGSVAGTIAFVLFGASLTEFDGSMPQFDLRILMAGIAIFLLSLMVSRYFKGLEAARVD